MNFPDALNLGVVVYYDLIGFLETGGDVLVVIMAVTFVLWALIVERFWYFGKEFRKVKKQALTDWKNRRDHESWYARQIRRGLIGSVQLKMQKNLGMIKGLVAVAPLLGLLGTVTGMLEVFDVMALTEDDSNTRAMAAGVSEATITTMAGMVVSITGLAFSSLLDRRANNEMRQVLLSFAHIDAGIEHNVVNDKAGGLFGRRVKGSA